MLNTFISFSLKLHAFGLSKLQDPNYTGLELYDHVKEHVRGKSEPKDMLRKTIDNGILYHMGLWFYKKYLFLDVYDGYYDEIEIENLEGEYQSSYLDDVIPYKEFETWSWYLEDIVQLLTYHKEEIPSANTNIQLKKAIKLLDYIQQLFNQDEFNYFRYLDGQGRIEIIKTYLELRESFRNELDNLASRYAANYADRVFHDRELCNFIAELLVIIGFGDSGEDVGAKKWVERHRWPEWTKSVLRARDRGKCANCGADLCQELEDNIHIDHIVPISKGGCNDLVNLQILCQGCNLKKKNKLLKAKSSIPPYMRRRLIREQNG